MKRDAFERLKNGCIHFASCGGRHTGLPKTGRACSFVPIKKTMKKRSIAIILRYILLAILAIPLLYYGAYFLFRGEMPANPQVIAHRGGTLDTPENTLAAFENAIALGVDWLEMDVQRTRDGVLVVIHDTMVDRTTNGTGKVGDFTLAQLRALDAGNGEHIPTFEDVISLAKIAGVKILPEAKSPQLYAGLGADMATMLAESDYVQNSAVQSFSVDALREIHVANADLQLCRLYGRKTFSLRDPQPIAARILCPPALTVLVNPWMVKQAHTGGRQIFVWMGDLENPVTVRLLLAMGVDGLMVNDPAQLLEIVGRN